MRERRPLFSSSRRFVFCVAAWGEQAARAQRRQQSAMPQGQLQNHLKHAIGAQPPSAHPSHATMFFEAQRSNDPNNPPATFLCVEAHLQLGPQLGHLHQQLLRVDGGILRGTNSPRASGGQGWRILDPAKRARAQQRENGYFLAVSHRVVLLEQSPLLHHGFPVCSVVLCWISRSVPLLFLPSRRRTPSFWPLLLCLSEGPESDLASSGSPH